MAKKDSRRFFKKRESHEILDHQSVKNEPVISELPQNSGLIPASVYYWFLVGLYSLVLFGVSLIVIFTGLRPREVSSSPSYNLINSPASSTSHLLYLEWLISHYRLTDFAREVKYIENSRLHGLYPDLDVIKYTSLQSEGRNKEQFFHDAIAEYAFWIDSEKLFPGYRDGLYRRSQLAFILYNSEESKRLIESAVYLDPRFTLGKAVLDELKK